MRCDVYALGVVLDCMIVVECVLHMQYKEGQVAIDSRVLPSGGRKFFLQSDPQASNLQGCSSNYR